MRFKRSVILINPRYQNRAGFFSGLMAIMGLLIGVGSLVLLPILIGAFSRQRTYVPTNIIDMLMISFPWLVLGLGLVFTVSIFVGIFYSHRLAGPLYKIEVSLKERLKGKVIDEIQLRPNDHLHNLAKLLNDLVQREYHVEQACQELLTAVNLIQDNTELANENKITIPEEHWQTIVESATRVESLITSQPSKTKTH